MKKLGLGLLVNGVSLWIIDGLFSGISFTPRALIMMSVILMILNALVKPVLQLLTLPLNALSFGLFSILLNGMILWMAFRFVPGAYFNNFLTITMAGAVLGVLNALLNKLVGNE